MDRIGESYMLKHSSLAPGSWVINDESISRRQLHYVGAFFHFRHWDDFSTTGLRTMWNKDMKDEFILPSCMVNFMMCLLMLLRMRIYKVLFLGIAN